MLSQPFFQHALLGGTAIAVLCGLVGYVLVLRAQVFAGDALTHVAYAGAFGALAAGVDLRFGLFTATVGVGLLLGLLGGRSGGDDVVIGTTFAWVLGLGVLFVSIYTTHGSAANGAVNATVLFGSIFGISASAALTATWIAAAVVLLLALLGRPLLFASVDPAVALARGVPVTAVGAAFLALVGATAAEASQAVGALLLLGLLAAPAAAAHRLSSRPAVGLTLSVLLSLLAMTGGLALAYAAPRVPPSFAILSIATAQFCAAALWTNRHSWTPLRARQRWTRSAGPAG